jgi:hypothetical protein
VHYGVTATLTEVEGFRRIIAHEIGEGDNGVDGFVGPTGWLVGLGWHFDIDTEGGSVPSHWDQGDSRYRHSGEELARAVHLCACEFRVRDAAEALGKSLHPLQDF